MAEIAHRRSARSPRVIKIGISAVLPDGRVVTGPAETLVVGKFGARIHTKLRLTLGSLVKITMGDKPHAEAIVTWASKESPFEFGIELTTAKDFWDASS